MILCRFFLAALLIILLALGTGTTRAPGAEDQPPASAAEKASTARTALDQELLEDLGADPLGDDPAVVPGERATDAPPKSTRGSGDALDQELLKGLNDGEDLGQPGEQQQNPLARIGQQMRDVEQSIARRQADQETRRRQTQIVRDIDDLIRQAQQQKKNNHNNSGGRSSAGSTSGSGQNQPQPARRPEVAQPQSRTGEGNSAANNAARDSEKKVRDQQLQKPDMAAMREILKGVWGQLPERQREQMLQSYEEQFLPKYEQMIADYFRSLSEENGRKP